jgi:folate-binding Fe-S cluster repair protein YgfZ
MGRMIIQRMNTTSNLQASSATPANRLDGVAALSHLGVIKVEGEDAAKFIHGQLSQDFSLLDLHTARLAAFCSPKGRVLASFIGFKRNAHEILLICSKDILPATLKRLSMFVMRAKATLSDASPAYQMFGLAGSAAKSIASGDYSTRAKVDLMPVPWLNWLPQTAFPDSCGWHRPMHPRPRAHHYRLRYGFGAK